MSVEDSPEFKKALTEACETQYREYMYGGTYASAKSKDTIADTMEEIQRQRREIEEKVEEAKRYAGEVRERARIMGDPHMREITENLRKLHSAGGGLICPSCGDTNQGNRMNGKPWCMKCGLPLLSQEKAEKWVKPQPSKRASRTFSEPDGVMKWHK